LKVFTTDKTDGKEEEIFNGLFVVNMGPKNIATLLY
jgi:hypothetical protein